MIYVYLIKSSTRIEYSNNSTEEWSGKTNLYSFTSEKEALKHIFGLKQEESKKYSEWKLKNEEVRGLFLHHWYEIEKIDVFGTSKIG